MLLKYSSPAIKLYSNIDNSKRVGDEEDLELLDIMLDDGDLTQGKFRQTPNGRYTYIIEE